MIQNNQMNNYNMNSNNMGMNSSNIGINSGNSGMHSGNMGMNNNNMGINSNNMGMNNNNFNGNGEFLLTIISAQSVKKEDFLSKSDPYISIKTNNQTLKTKTVKNTATPTWNEQFRISAFNDIELLMMDDDILKDDQMGKTILYKDRLMKVGMNDEEINLPILMKGKEVGILHIRLKRLDGQNYQQGGHHSFESHNQMASNQSGHQQHHKQTPQVQNY